MLALIRVDGATDRARSGPFGRLARLGGASVTAFTLLSIVDARGPARFRDPHVLTEPSAWLLHALMLVVLVILVGAVASSLGGRVAVRYSQVAAVAALVVIAAMAGVWGQLIYGSVWGFPLADVVWSFDVAMLAAEFVAFVLAIILATPGCEVGIWADLIGRMRGKGSAGFSAPSCIVGLHLLDEWEARPRVRLTKHSA